MANPTTPYSAVNYVYKTPPTSPVKQPGAPVKERVDAAARRALAVYC